MGLEKDRVHHDLAKEHRIEERQELPANQQAHIPDGYDNVFLLFNMEAAFAEGHCVLGVGPVDGNIMTYSFYRDGNQFKAPGKMACLEQPEPFTDIVASDGWLIHGQPANWWNEHMNAALALAIPHESYAPIVEYAEQCRKNPPEYDLVSFNCLTFALSALERGHVDLTTSDGSDLHTIVPRDAFDRIDGAHGAIRYGQWKYWFDSVPAPQNSFRTIPD